MPAVSYQTIDEAATAAGVAQFSSLFYIIDFFLLRCFKASPSRLVAT